MILENVKFVAYKSLLNKELSIKKSCTGFVGINESGKSNVLEGLSVLGQERKLKLKDTPRMARNNSPEIIYEFSLSEKEEKRFSEIFKTWLSKKTTLDDFNLPKDLVIQFNVIYEKEKEEERRFYKIKGLKGNNYLFLKNDTKVQGYKLATTKGIRDLNESIIITKEDIKHTKDIEQKNDKILAYNSEIEQLNRQIDEIRDKSEEVKENEDILNSLNIEIDTIKEKINKIEEKKLKIVDDLGDYDHRKIISKYKKELISMKSEIAEKKKKSKEISTQIAPIQNSQNINPQQKSQLEDLQNQIDEIDNEIESLQKAIDSREEALLLLKQSVEEKYTDEIEYFCSHIPEDLTEYLETIMPNVVFWEYDDKYLLNSEFLLEEILSAKNVDSISRPLLNIFRIGLGIQGLKELKDIIKETQDESNERSRISVKLTNGANRFLKNIWNNYDQDLKISLEKDRIRFEIFDPKKFDASYYSLVERSQGCQTFISFLLTIGAEAEHGVLTNTILLLDEPETHLHPSGVRYMLKELINIASNNNIVVYATHSIFMIDRNDFSRHIILEKKNEETIIKPSMKDRIGLFMQEEVLYSTLDIDLNKDFTSTTLVNFVFEGDGDATIFEHFYNKIIKAGEVPFKRDTCSFYHGGKCTDIQRYLINKPIQLGTKWVFITDSDAPANKLKSFIEGKYKKYINTDIFLFQYKKDSLPEVELEDLLPMEVLQSAFDNTKKALNKDEIVFELCSTKENGYSDIFQEYLDAIKEDKQIVQPIFKSELNKIIKKDTDGLSKEKFIDRYSAFNDWADEVITLLREKTKS